MKITLPRRSKALWQLGTTTSPVDACATHDKGEDKSGGLVPKYINCGTETIGKKAV